MPLPINYRGLARADSSQSKGAIADMKSALQLYRKAGNTKGMTRAENKLRMLRAQTVSHPLRSAQNWGAYIVDAIVDPIGSLRT
ncbi:MAG: hypothetical protein HC810_08485, partial [Acaryochloridaceae cyanobacterium RL_2_7]|nr:hypothetical protein [Acaryochloridaceae cyanobacterium RL_2_7]